MGIGEALAVSLSKRGMNMALLALYLEAKQHATFAGKSLYHHAGDILGMPNAR